VQHGKATASLPSHHRERQCPRRGPLPRLPLPRSQRRQSSRRL